VNLFFGYQRRPSTPDRIFIMRSSLAHLLLHAATALGLGICFASAQTPSDYFGGLDHDTYVAWAETSSYTKTTFLNMAANGDEGVAVHWTIDDTHINLAVAARATGWVGFGIAESGGMRGSDIVLFEAASNTLTDAHVLDQLVAPITDGCQNWELVSSLSDGGFIIFEAKRLVDTGDSQDRPIIDDSSLEVAAHNVIAAWSDSTTISYHGVNNRVRNTIRFYGDIGSETMLLETKVKSEAEGFFMLGANDYLISTNETEYVDFCLSSEELIAMGVPMNLSLHTIGVEPVVDPRGEKYVHHFLVSGSTFAGCGESLGPDELTYIWAPGMGPFILPPNVGGLFGSDGFKSFNIQIHYNNPSEDDGILDSSGVNIYFTSQKREHDLGVLQLGDPFVFLNGVNVGNGFSEHTFNCPGSCSSVSVAQNITVLREFLHMHKSGSRMYNTQIRGGETVHTGSVDYFDFDQSGAYSVIQPTFEILPGDSFKTSCYYSTASDEKFGLSSQEEMCIAYLFYYPRQVLDDLGLAYTCAFGLGDVFGFPQCENGWSTTSLASVDQFERTFGTPSTTCDNSSSNINSAAPTEFPSSPASSLMSPAPVSTTPTIDPLKSPSQSPLPAPTKPPAITTSSTTTSAAPVLVGVTTTTTSDAPCTTVVDYRALLAMLFAAIAGMAAAL
jgi:dopamine beta-monooxygenase